MDLAHELILDYSKLGRGSVRCTQGVDTYAGAMASAV